MLKWSAGQVGLPPVATFPSFDFVVAERPRYIPGSGPALAPITAMPPHDKDGFIIDKVQFKRQLRYLVGYEEYPQLKVSVQPENILDWVSRHALEQWEAQRYDEEERRREEEELPLILAKEERKRKRLEAKSRAAQSIDGRKAKRKQPTDEFTPTKTGRPAKAGRVGKAPKSANGRSRRSSTQHELDEEMIFTSPRQSQRSRRSQQPSLSTPSHRFSDTAMMDTESNDEGSIDTDMAIELQLGITDSMQPSRCSSESAKILGGPKRPTSKSNAEDSSAEEIRVAASARPKRHASILPGQSAVAATSSREALKIYEDLEHKKKSAAKSILANRQSPLKRKSSSLPSHAYKPSNNKSTPAERPSSRSITTSEEPESSSDQDGLESDEDGTDYEIHEILDEEMRKENGKQVLYYLINWVGEYDNTWEPARNVSEAAITDFKEKRTMQRTSKANKPWRGQVVDDDDDDDDDDESED